MTTSGEGTPGELEIHRAREALAGSNPPATGYAPDGTRRGAGSPILERGLTHDMIHTRHRGRRSLGQMGPIAGGPVLEPIGR
jgi:hypothetical protein